MPCITPGKAASLCALGVGRSCAGLGFGRGLFAHRFACEREAVVVLHQPVEHRVSNRGVAYPFEPVLDRQLAGDDGCACVGTIINDLQQISPGLRIHGRHAPGRLNGAP